MNNRQQGSIYVLLANKKGFFDYEVLEQYEAGIVLTGAEVKSVKQHQVSFKGSFVTIQQGVAWLEGLHISQYKYSGNQPHDPIRKKKLLLKKNEIDTILGFLGQKGLTVIPLEIYTKGSLIKIRIGVCRGKKKYDKREQIKKREVDREVKRGLAFRY